MKGTGLMLVAVLMTGMPAVVSLGAAEPLTAEQIMSKVEDLLWGDTMYSRARMIITTPDWERTLTMDSWSEGTRKSFIRILEPRKERGVTFLKLESQMWNYLPRIDRVVRIPPSMMMSSWMGSDFTNDDLARESSISEDYMAELLGSGVPVDGMYHLSLTPRPDVGVVWARLEFDVRESDLMPLKARYYDEDGQVVREMTYADFKQMGERTIPTRMTVEPRTEQDRGRTTELVLEEVRFNEKLDEDLFTERNLKRGMP
ncbi:outer membrane lipoprotein-sorting protein [bacterium]|nr:outer membrane lipoprotein-sorting protein [candidate division CSSED10-310 bacterium]